MSDIAKVLAAGLRESAKQYRAMLRRVATGATGVKCAMSSESPPREGPMAQKTTEKTKRRTGTKKTAKKGAAPKTARAKRGTRKAAAKKTAE